MEKIRIKTTFKILIFQEKNFELNHIFEKILLTRKRNRIGIFHIFFFVILLSVK